MAAIERGESKDSWKAKKLADIKDPIEQQVETKLLDEAWTNATNDISAIKMAKDAIDNGLN